MSAATATADALPTPPREYARPGLGRLIAVELRKMLDTRAGFWLQMTIGASTIAIILIFAFAGNADDHEFMQMLWVAGAPASILLPVVGVLLVSSEWSQRTAMVTFTLVPQRMRVMLAKGGAALVAALAAFVAAFVIAVIGTAVISADTPDLWSMPIDLVGQTVLSMGLLMIMGVAFGAVFLNSAPAIVFYFILPTVLSALGSINAIEDVVRWLDVQGATTPLTDHALSATEWGRVATSVALWVLLPLVIGLWRIAKSDPK